jgi:hypothetical protein
MLKYALSGAIFSTFVKIPEKLWNYRYGPHAQDV